MNHLRLACVAALATVLSSTNASASVTYEFSGHGVLGLLDAQFTYVSPDFVTGFRHVDASALQSCTVTSALLPCDYIEFYPLDSYYPEDQFILDSLLVFRDNSGGNPPVQGRLATFSLGAFTTPGTYTIGDEDFGETLVVRASPTVPEPATWAMMLLGFGMIGAAARYRRRSSKVTFA